MFCDLLGQRTCEQEEENSKARERGTREGRGREEGGRRKEGREGGIFLCASSFMHSRLAEFVLLSLFSVGRDAVTNLFQRSSSSLGTLALRDGFPSLTYILFVGISTLCLTIIALTVCGGGVPWDCRAKRAGVLSRSQRVRSTWGLETRAGPTR